MAAPTVPDRALVLLAHGARDPRWAEPLTRIQQLIRASLNQDTQIHQAFLELMTPALPDLVDRLIGQGVRDMVVVPVFLGQGTHVRNDLPKLIGQLQANYPDATITLTDAIGESEPVLRAIAEACLHHLGASG